MSFKGNVFVGALAVGAVSFLGLGGCTTTVTTNPFAGLVPDGGIVRPSGDAGRTDASSSTGTGPCADYCNKAASANCSKQSSCEADCKTQQSQTPASCTSTLDDMLSCASSKGTFSGCSTSGKPTLKGCDTEAMAYLKCAQSAANPDAGTKQDSGVNPGNCGGLSLSPQACNNCFKQSCCTQGTTCGANSECMAIITCFQGCGANDTTCFNNCMSAHPNGSADLNAVDQCLSSSCNTECQ